jgi:hypothetical protein
MTERARTPSARFVFWGALFLFAVLFALVTYRYAGEQSATARAVHVRKVLERRVVTTVVPSPGQSTVSSAPAESSVYSSAPEPVVTSSS